MRCRTCSRGEYPVEYRDDGRATHTRAGARETDMRPSIQARATLYDLYGVEGKAELIGGRIVRYMGSGRRPVRVASRIFRSLDDYAVANGRGETYTDGMTFGVPELTSGRESFMPDVSYYF